MNLPPLTYLATDSLQEGVGVSQILAYVERLAARGLDIRLHTFEKQPPGAALHARVSATGIAWVAHPFGSLGPRGGLQRIVAGARAVRGAELVHARSDLAAASALLARAPRLVWDARALFADQRIALGALRAGSPEHRALRLVESRAARSSTAITCLTHAMVEVLDARYGGDVAAKATVITTCVDTDRFRLQPPEDPDPLVFLLAGTLNRYYDVPAMVALVRAAAQRRPAQLLVAGPPNSWADEFATVDHRQRDVPSDGMPALIASSHVGLSVCREDAGISLRGAMPTKIGEFLATGRPVVVNPGLGDAGTLLTEHGCGVTLASGRPEDVARALDDLEQLLDDTTTAARCRALACAHFDLDAAVDALVGVYRHITG